MSLPADNKPIDTFYGVETPEGAILQVAPAGPLVRGLAWAIDASIRAVILISSIIAFSGLRFAIDEGPETITGLFLIIQFLLSWMYTTLFEAVTGTTPGKRIFRLWVVHDNATPLTPAGAVIRNFLRIIDGLPVLNITGLICMLIDSRFRRLGDLAAGTVVVYRDLHQKAEAFEYSKATPPPAWLNRQQKQSIVDFAERSAVLSTERQQELADTLAPIISNQDDRVGTIKAWAQWILHGQSNAESKSV